MNQHGYIGRKMRHPNLQERAATIIAAFGSSSRAKEPLALFAERYAQTFPGEEPFWAYTSAIIRKKTGLPGLQETLARVEAAGYRKAVVQPLHVFPGTEYQQLAEICGYFPGVRVVLGETLLHRWDFLRETLAVLEEDFLHPDAGTNLLALHGTPLAADPVNIVYLGLERLVADLYPNVLAASIEGVPDHEALFARLRRQGGPREVRRLRILPVMFFAGVHADEDLMGESDSWRTTLEAMGYEVDSPTCPGGACKGLAHYPRILDFFMERLERGKRLIELY